MDNSKLYKYLSFVTLIGFIVSGCTIHKVIAIYDAPKILVPYEEIINSYHLVVEENSHFSTKEIQETFTLIKNIENDPKVKELNIIIRLYGMRLSKDKTGYIVVGMGYLYGPTYGAGNQLYFHHRSGGKFELISISRWVA